jgi:membrane peptidoglycan carboxypeptidase
MSTISKRFVQSNVLRKKSGRRKKLLFLTYLATAVLVLNILGLVGVTLLFAIFARELPNPDQLLERTSELSTRYYDRNNNLIFEQYGEKNRTLVKFADIPPYIIHATLATEDANFYIHKGFDPVGMLRALKNTFTGSGLQGGSTLTQQVIKNTLLTNDRTVIRKIKELILSLQLENRYSKDEIIQMYLNESPYGGQNYGIFSAAKAYFNKDPKNLDLAESAYLAGLTQSPSYYSAFGTNPEAGLERKDYVLSLMKDRGWTGPDGKRYYLSQADYDKARAETLKFQTEKIPLAAPHFIFYTKQYLSNILGENVVDSGGLSVKTSLDPTINDMAQNIVYQEITKAENAGYNVYNGAMVVIDPKTGQILTMIGSKGYNLDPEPAGCVSGATGATGCKFDPYVNVTLANRQPGSAIKPITYATFLSKGYTVAYPFIDVDTKFPGSSPDQPYEPVDYEGTFLGPVSMRRALGNSLNIPAVKALQIVGIDNMVNQAAKMGVTSIKDAPYKGLAITLGGVEAPLLDLTNAYAIFADKGLYNAPTPIIEVTDSKGNVLYKPSTPPTQVLGEDVSFLISDILSDDSSRIDAFGAHSLLYIPNHTVAVKTGTTDDKRDNYAIGYTPSIVAGVWVGNNNNDAMNQQIASGITGASPIWNDFMTQYLKDKPDEKFDVPSNVEKFTVDKLTGMLPYKNYDTRSEWFIKGTEPTAKSDWYQSLEICKIDGRIANQGCKDAGETTTKNFIKIQAELSQWQPYVYDWVKKNKGSDPQYYPPEMTSQLEFDDSGNVTNKNDVNVQIDDLKDGQEVPLTFRMNVEASAYNDVRKATFYMDGNKVADDSSEPFGYTLVLDKDKMGTHTFSATVTDSKGNKGSAKLNLDVVGYSN